MTEKTYNEELMQDVLDAKNFSGRKFQMFTNNFYVIKAAVRYFCIKNGQSVTSSRISDSFPVTVPVAGSCLKILEELDIIEVRKKSTSANRYMPSTVDMERLLRIETLLQDNHEINSFY